MDRLNSVIDSINAFAWGPPMLGMLGVTGCDFDPRPGVHAVAQDRLWFPVAVR